MGRKGIALYMCVNGVQTLYGSFSKAMDATGLPRSSIFRALEEGCTITDQKTGWVYSAWYEGEEPKQLSENGHDFDRMDIERERTAKQLKEGHRCTGCRYWRDNGDHKYGRQPGYCAKRLEDNPEDPLDSYGISKQNVCGSWEERMATKKKTEDVKVEKQEEVKAEVKAIEQQEEVKETEAEKKVEEPKKVEIQEEKPVIKTAPPTVEELMQGFLKRTEVFYGCNDRCRTCRYYERLRDKETVVEMCHLPGQDIVLVKDFEKLVDTSKCRYRRKV